MRILGIDQSYTNFGISVVEGTSMKDAKVIRVKSYNYKGMRSKTEKRLFIRKLVKRAIKKYEPDVIVFERIRQFSQNFLSMPYVKATAALVGVIIDVAYPQEVYSVDTRSWKSRVCGKSKGMHKADKGVSVRFVRKRFKLELNDDEADAICIACYPLTSSLDKLKKDKLLKLED